MTTTTTETTSASDSEIDDALLAALRQAPGGLMPWAELRELLPESAYWVRVASLCRVQAAGLVDVEKIDGKNFVSVALTPAVRRRP